MKKWIFFLLAAITLRAEVPFDYSYADICCPASRCEAYARVLYWKASIPPFTVAFEDPTIKQIRPSYKVGFQVGGRLLSVNHYTVMQGDYTQIDSRNSERFTGFFVPTGFGTANAELLIKYKSGYLAGGRYLYRRGDFGLYFYTGGRYSNIIEEHRIESNVERLSFEGGGPVFGIGGESAAYCGFQGVGRLSLFGLIGKQSDKITEGRAVIYKQRTHTICVPGMAFRFALSYTRCGREGWQLIGEVGYQFDLYMNAISGSLFLSGPRFFNTFKHNVIFCGPYAGLRLRY